MPIIKELKDSAFTAGSVAMYHAATDIAAMTRNPFTELLFIFFCIMFVVCYDYIAGFVLLSGLFFCVFPADTVGDNIAHCPCSLKVEASSDSVHIKDFPCKVESGVAA